MTDRRKRVTVDLPAGLAAAAERTGLSLADLVRRGIYGPPAWPAAAPPPRPAPQPPPLALVPDLDNECEPPTGVAAAVDTRPQTWVCSCCSHRQAIGTVGYCEQCGLPRSREAAR